VLSYKKLWKLFLKTEADEFVCERKLTLEEIRKIGVKKFVRANDWRTEGDVSKWRTDVYDIIPCPNCGKDFGVMDYTLGLCNKCCSKFDLFRFYRDMKEVEDANSINSVEFAGKMLTLFLCAKPFRDSYLKQ